MIFLYFLTLVISFAFLIKCADLFVDSACSLANILRIPKMVIGIVLVGLATTAPEFGVSVFAALLGHPEISLGNAIGSVICDDGIALGLAAVLAPLPILVNCRLVRIIGAFLIGVDILAYLLARNGTIGRLEGLTLLVILAAYYFFLLKYRRFAKEPKKEAEFYPSSKRSLLKRPVFLFIAGIAGVVIASNLIIWAARNIAEFFSISETVIGLTVIAIGTSLPEISTCVTASLKGEGELAVGNILGADVLNILWIVGASSLVNPITVELRVINFTFPFMIFIVFMMLVFMLIRCRLGRVKGIFLIGFYLLYIFLILALFT